MRRMYSENQIAELVKKNPQAVVKALEGQDISVEGITSKGIANTGNIATTGNITGKSIIQDNSGYSSSSDSPSSKVEIDYKGAVQNGNKVTFVIAGKINAGESGVPTFTGLNLGGFNIPSEVKAKLIPIYNQFIDFERLVLPLSDLSNQITVSAYTTRDSSNDKINMLINTMGASMAANSVYLFRYEVTFLLSESLTSE